MKKLVYLLLILLFLKSHSQDKKICITVDDLPVVTNGIPGYDFRLEVTNSLIKTFNEFNIPAIGYVNEGKLYAHGTLDSMELKLLKLWVKNGLELGNHTFSHMNYHIVPFDQYTKDILRGEMVIKGLANQYQTDIKYFRHPYLRIGLRESHADSLKVFLNKHGYTEAPVTIDNEDYLFAAAYSKAYKKNDSILMKRIAKDYIEYMEEKLTFYERQSIKLFGRQIDQILLIHANYLNSQYLDKLVHIYIKHGYKFISQTEVLKDPAYKEEVSNFGNWGISWIDRWALSRGEQGKFFEGEPRTPDYINELMK